MPAPIIPGPQAKLVELAQGLIHPVWYAWLQGWQRLFDIFERSTNDRLAALEILAPMAWARWNAAATTVVAQGCSVARNGVGDWTVTVTVSPLAGSLTGIVSGGRTATQLVTYDCIALTDSTYRIGAYTVGLTLTDPTTADIITAVFFGDY